jgi:ferric-dicitrate binding protein FerR (iron transport regulator)
MHGRLTFDDRPLHYVIETLDRYSPHHIAVSPSAGALRFSGIVFDNKIDDWLQSLEAIFPVTVEDTGGDIRIQMRPSIPVNGDVAPK